MTENEAISVLKMIEAHGSLSNKAKDMAIQALEEIQQYRAIGTIEEIKSEHKELIELSRRYIKDTNELIKYQSIGTVEEFKALKDGGIPIIHGKAELELHDKEIRNKAIDEFVERLDDLILHGVFDSRNHLHECIYEIAEQMKGGAENE